MGRTTTSRWGGSWSGFHTARDPGAVDLVDSHHTVLLLADPLVTKEYVLYENFGFPGLRKTVFRY